jgi:DNA-binding GntR family transcriptional regulator
MSELSELAHEVLSRRRSTPALVADALRDAILRGTFKSGDPLPQDDIARQFGLSRIPVREALRQLEGEGLVTFYPHRGAVVSTLSAAELREICEMRVALESLALRLAIPAMTEEAVTQAEQILDETDRETEVVATWSSNNWRFHSTLYGAADRPRLLKMIKGLHDNVDRYLRLHVSLLDYKEKGQQEHRQILRAVRDGDVEGSVGLLEHHVSGVAQLLGDYLDRDSHKE